mgnify:CR=1 FL=1|jgi:hypothetical protein
MKRIPSRAGAPLAAALLLVLLAGCFPGAPTPSTTTPSSAPTSAAPTDDSEDEDGDATPTPTPTPSLSASDRANIRDAVTSGNTAAIEGYLADPVQFIIMSSECCGPLMPTDAVAELNYIASATPPWDFNLPPATVAEWRTNQYYGSLFTGDDITGRAADGSIVQFGVSGDRIVSILVGFEEGFSF